MREKEIVDRFCAQVADGQEFKRLMCVLFLVLSVYKLETILLNR